MRFSWLVFLLFNFLFVDAQKNVIIIISDDLGADYCGFHPDALDTAKMPNIRNLLHKGVSFAKAWASPYCSSTRAGVLTGRYSFRTGVGTVIGAPNSNDLAPAEISIAEMLKQYAPVPYATANIGKWHINVQTPVKLLYPTQQFGYDLYKGNFSGTLPSYTNWVKITNGTQTDTITTYATTETVNDAIGWLDTVPANKPFFLWLAFNAPHTPFHLPPANLHTVPGLTGLPGHINQFPELYFKAAVEAMDTETGRLIQWLQVHNRMDSTTIIFMGDNGNDKRVAQNPDTTHCKGTLYEHGIHVPFMASGAGIVNPNRTTDALLNTQDIFATVMELCGISNWAALIPAATTIDSKSFLPVLKDQGNTIRNWIFTELFTVPNATVHDGKTIRNDTFKLIRFDNGNQEFYNISYDADEQQDLLLQNLNATELSNYQYLCNELSALCGIASCQAGVGVRDVANKPDWVTATISGNTLFSRLSLNAELKIYSLTGQLVATNQLQAGWHSIDVSLLPAGIYMLHFRSEKGCKGIKVAR